MTACLVLDILSCLVLILWCVAHHEPMCVLVIEVGGEI